MKKTKVYGLRTKKDSTIRYIGITDKKLEVRLRKHWSNRHRNYPKHCWMKKHGFENIEIVPLQECNSREEALELEQSWISLFRKFVIAGNEKGKELLNIANGGEGLTSEEAKKMWANPEYQKNISAKTKKRWENPDFRENMSAKRKEMWKDKDYQKNISAKAKKQMEKQWKNPEFRKKVCKPVDCFTLENKFIQRFPSIAEASHFMKVAHSGICKVCSGKRKSAGGFKWRFVT